MKLSITQKIVIMMISMMLICNLVGGIANRSIRGRDVITANATAAMDVANTIALSIEAEKYAGTIQSSVKDDYWYSVQSYLTKVARSNRLEYLYIMQSGYDDTIRYFAEGRVDGDGCDFNETDALDVFPDEMYITLETGESTATGSYVSGDYGEMVSGFSAICDKDGKVIGVVGADFLIDDMQAAFAAIMNRIIFFILLLSSVFAVVAMLLSQKMIGRPLKKLTAGVTKLGGGDLDTQIDIRSRDEIGLLASAFNKMTVDLKASIEANARERAEKERIGAELDVATKLQAGLLPCIFPAFPDRSEFDIYATMLPAKEVGGDFYDFFLVGPDQLAVVVADVSGKGVPAALFMVIAKTLIKNLALLGTSPAEVFETTNNMLCDHNEVGMFVTAFMGVLDIPSDRFTYVNAGHNPPLVRNADGDYSYLKTKAGFVLAGMEDIRYKQEEIVFRKGDTLFMYTDGVTEAANRQDELFGEPRLLTVLNQNKQLPLAVLLPMLKQKIDVFADGAEQADDITMLGVMIR